MPLAWCQCCWRLFVLLFSSAFKFVVVSCLSPFSSCISTFSIVSHLGKTQTRERQSRRIEFRRNRVLTYSRLSFFFSTSAAIPLVLFRPFSCLSCLCRVFLVFDVRLERILAAARRSLVGTFWHALELFLELFLGIASLVSKSLGDCNKIGSMSNNATVDKAR